MKRSDSRQKSGPRPLPEKGACDAAPPCALPCALILTSPAEEAAGALVGVSLADLREEGANMLRLALAQEGAGTPLSISSRQAQVVLGQF